MKTSIVKAAGATLIVGAALLAAGCGDRTEATNNSAAVTGATNDFQIGPDASAVETVGSANTTGPVLPMTNATAPAGGNASATTPLAEPSDTPPGGDRGGNTVESNVAGM
jgi:hypothetical protein